MELKPNLKVLDVGCGAGTMTVPLAERVRSVTALDLSPVMLRYLESSISEHNLTNVRLVNADFLEVDPADIGHFDIVLASRSLPMGDLRQALTRMDNLSQKLCYLTWLAGRSEDDAEICEFLGVDYYPYPDYLIIANMLYTMGIYASVEIFTTTSERLFSNIDDAITYALHGREVNDRECQRLSSYFKERLSFWDGSWCFRQANRWALIWWRKE
jgi:SAM-dependent methyltransferase